MNSKCKVILAVARLRFFSILGCKYFFLVVVSVKRAFTLYVKLNPKLEK